MEAGTGGVYSMFVAETALADWGDNMIAWWALEETTTATRVNSAGAGTCGGTGTKCDLAASGSIPNDTTNFQEGIASNNWSAIEADALNCTDANCSPLERAGSGDHSLSMGCWFRPALTGIDNTLLTKQDTLAGADGFSLTTNTDVAPKAKFYVAATSVLSSGTSALNTWGHYAGVFDDTGDTIAAYMNGVAGSTAAVSSLTENARPFYVGGDGTNHDVVGRIDECWVYAGALAAASICRICSCGLSGSLCKCGSGVSATAFATTGRNGDSCGSCALPANCSAAAPS